MGPCYGMAKAAVGAYCKILALGKLWKRNFFESGRRYCPMQLGNVAAFFLMFPELAKKGVTVNAVW